jgi:segregation and condensation protein B
MELKLVLESLLFSAQKPLTPKELRDLLIAAAEPEGIGPEVKALRKTKEANLVAALEELARDIETVGRTFRLACVAGAWQFVSLPEYAPWLRALVGVKARPPRLSQPGLETLAIIAYRQPITRSEIEQVRGVSVDGVMQTLLDRGLVVAVGRAEVVGRPITYGTTPYFLEYFGLGGLNDLPAAEELRRIPVEKPPAPVTAEPGLATVPPEQLTLAQVEHPTVPADAPAPDPTVTADPPTAAPE